MVPYNNQNTMDTSADYCRARNCPGHSRSGHLTAILARYDVRCQNQFCSYKKCKGHAKSSRLPTTGAGRVTTTSTARATPTSTGRITTTSASRSTSASIHKAIVHYRFCGSKRCIGHLKSSSGGALLSTKPDVNNALVRQILTKYDAKLAPTALFIPITTKDKPNKSPVKEPVRYIAPRPTYTQRNAPLTSTPKFTSTSSTSSPSLRPHKVRSVTISPVVWCAASPNGDTSSSPTVLVAKRNDDTPAATTQQDNEPPASTDSVSASDPVITPEKATASKSHDPIKSSSYHRDMTPTGYSGEVAAALGKYSVRIVNDTQGVKYTVPMITRPSGYWRSEYVNGCFPLYDGPDYSRPSYSGPASVYSRPSDSGPAGAYNGANDVYCGPASAYSGPTSAYSGPTSAYSGPTSAYSGPGDSMLEETRDEHRESGIPSIHCDSDDGRSSDARFTPIEPEDESAVSSKVQNEDQDESSLPQGQQSPADQRMSPEGTPPPRSPTPEGSPPQVSPTPEDGSEQGEEEEERPDSLPPQQDDDEEDNVQTDGQDEATEQGTDQGDGDDQVGR